MDISNIVKLSVVNITKIKGNIKCSMTAIKQIKGKFYIEHSDKHDTLRDLTVLICISLGLNVHFNFLTNVRYFPYLIIFKYLNLKRNITKGTHIFSDIPTQEDAAAQLQKLKQQPGENMHAYKS